MNNNMIDEIAFYRKQLETLDPIKDSLKYSLYQNELNRILEMDSIPENKDESQILRELITHYANSLVDLDPEKDLEKYNLYTAEIERLQTILEDIELEKQYNNDNDQPLSR